MTDIGFDLLQGANITMPLREEAALLDFLRRHREGRAAPSARRRPISTSTTSADTPLPLARVVAP